MSLLAIILTLMRAQINMLPVSHVSMSACKKKKHNLEPREEAHLHFRARLSNLCRPLLICSLLPRPSALNGNKPKLRESKRPRIRLYKQFKRDISKGIYTNIINISQFPTLPLSCLAKSSFRAKWSFSLIGLANWLWLFAKKLLYLDANRSHTCTLTHTYMPLREKNNISIKAFSGACTNKICPFDQSSEYDEYIQWICQLGAFWLSNKLLAKLKKSHNILKLHLLHGKKRVFILLYEDLKQEHFKGPTGPILATSAEQI